MKSISTFSFLFTLHLMAYGQTTFAPIGAQWRWVMECEKPGVGPFYDWFTVTEDTVIQGKYCTRLRDEDWHCDNEGEKTYVHYDSKKVYRYDFGDDEFQLVLDFTKQAGESWRIKACGDSMTVNVLESVGPSRLVSVISDSIGDSWVKHGLHEWYGGETTSPLLLYELVNLTFGCTDYVSCYFDPTEGVLFGGADDCQSVSTKEAGINAYPQLLLYPNPVQDFLHIEMNHFVGTHKGQIRILNPMGQVIKEFPAGKLERSFTIPVAGWASGLYFLQYLEIGRIISTRRFIVAY